MCEESGRLVGLNSTLMQIFLKYMVLRKISLFPPIDAFQEQPTLSPLLVQSSPIASLPLKMAMFYLAKLVMYCFYLDLRDALLLLPEQSPVVWRPLISVACPGKIILSHAKALADIYCRVLMKAIVTFVDDFLPQVQPARPPDRSTCMGCSPLFSELKSPAATTCLN